MHKKLIICLLTFCLFEYLYSQGQERSSVPLQQDNKTLKKQPLQPLIISPQKSVDVPKDIANPKPEPIKKPPVSTQPPVKVAGNRKVTYVNLEHADMLSYDELLYPNAQLLKGNVVFSHDSVFLYCDSSYFYEANNSFEAFGNVQIVQGDTLFIYGDELYYDGNTKLAKLRHNVLMDNLSATLRTDSLNYDRAKNTGYYFDGGIIEDTLNTLTSEKGYYYPATKTAVFQTDVELVNPDFTINSDTLRYNTISKVASILGPTDIVYDKQTHIYSEYGWYNTDNEQSKLFLNSYVQHNSGKRLVGDTIFYDKKNGKGEGFSNVQLLDTVKKITLYGNYGYYIEKGEIGLVTDSARMVEYSTSDTLFLHADTLFTMAQEFVQDSTILAENLYTVETGRLETDTIGTDTNFVKNDSLTSLKDSVYKVFIGYPNVRFFRTDIQGICDSSYYCTKDSVLSLMRKPVAWSEQRQLSGDTIRIFPKNGTMDRIEIHNRSFVCDSVENKYFNQLSGKNMVGYILDNKLKKVDVRGNSESIYFPQEDDKSIIGMVQTISSLMNIYLKDSTGIDRIVILPKPSGSMLPVTSLTNEEMLYLENFNWQIEKKPVSKHDIFRNSYLIAYTSEANSVVQQKTNKKTTRRDDAKPIEEKMAKGKKKTTSTDNNRPSGFSNPSQGSGGNSTVRSSSTSSKSTGGENPAR
ncbi:MAG: hypothetical protein LBT04_01795 [Prevotellaceae bacterium]|jgi:lipopolysaccharide export system protein LptA|nr:hypothetical protein [Prevotellaceae bacterium]